MIVTSRTPEGETHERRAYIVDRVLDRNVLEVMRANSNTPANRNIASPYDLVPAVLFICIR